MKKIESYIRAEKLGEVKEALTRIGIQGMTIMEVRGFGRQRGHIELYQGAEYSLDFVPKMKIEIFVPAVDAPRVVEVLMHSASTGRTGDGKIFVLPVEVAVRIRTQERGIPAVSM
ncbi:MAG: P-II family nitrogen regulator [Nitrospirae bacterium]|nr:P-II family nitrogen regulator [Nitrospirota bacterium]